MAENDEPSVDETPAPPAPPLSELPLKDRLERQLRETSAMTRSRKARLAAAIAADVEVPSAEILAIAKLERENANMETYLRVRELTRRRART